ncbi:kinase-like domain-containing protein [Phascolomyces articulosus]|uniref:Kinase-like domain-containing protein n=1 Tax=Phascolomyces articulosus TaxID=60185 RepID=A0AAD5K974_9FUNG|nr:kinase-like domain-containing protein [Phascolomyces articulosus]
MHNESLDHHLNYNTFISSSQPRKGLPNDLHIDTQSLQHPQPYTPTKGREEYFPSSEMEQPMPVPLPNQRASGLITADGNRITSDSIPSLTSSATTALSPDVDDHGDCDVLPGSAPTMMARNHNSINNHDHHHHFHHDHHHPHDDDHHHHNHHPKHHHHHHHHHHPIRQHHSHNLHHPVRRCQSLANSPARVTSQSWGHMKSPAASFLSRFGMSDHLTTKKNEDEEIDDYAMDKVIGVGGFATVRRGYCISSGEKVAIKEYEKDDSKRLERELAIWKRLRHPHVLPMHKTVETESHMYAICDYCPGGTLLDLVRSKKQLSEDEARPLFIQLCTALRYLHNEARVCHKDIKLENVLLDENNAIRLCDFGLAVYAKVKLPSSTSTTTSTTANNMHYDDMDHEEDEVAGGSLAYSAPEQVLSRQPVASPMSDMWSLGVLLYTLVLGRLPFQDNYDPRLQQKILSGRYELPSNELSKDLCSLLDNLLQVNPNKRYTTDQVLQSAWCS